MPNLATQMNLKRTSAATLSIAFFQLGNISMWQTRPITMVLSKQPNFSAVVTCVCLVYLLMLNSQQHAPKPPNPRAPDDTKEENPPKSVTPIKHCKQWLHDPSWTDRLEGLRWMSDRRPGWGDSCQDSSQGPRATRRPNRWNGGCQEKRFKIAACVVLAFFFSCFLPIPARGLCGS